MDLRSGCLTSTDVCLNDGYIISGIKGQVSGFNNNLNKLLGSYFGIDHGSTNSVKAGPFDGLIAILAKSMTEIIITNVHSGFNDISSKLNSIGANGNYYSSSSCAFGDGALTCMIKGQNYLILTSLSDLKNKFDIFKSDFPNIRSSSCSPLDGTFVCFIKSQNYLLITLLSDLKNKFDIFKSDFPNISSSSCSPLDGTFVCFIKSQNYLVLTAFSDLKNKFDIFKSDSSNIRSSSCSPLDGTFVCFIKSQNYLVLTAFSDLKNKFDIFKSDSSNISISSCSPLDGTFVCFIKSQNYLLIQQLKKINIAGGEVIDYQAKLDLITKKLDDLIKKVGDISLTPSGTTIWDFLKELVRGVTTVLDGILDFLNNITDLIRDIVIPSDVSFITTEFNRINDKLSAKFSLVSTLSTTITTSFNVKESNLLAKDFTVTFPQYGSMTLLNVTYLNSVLPYAKRILSAVLYLLTAIYAYKKITNRMVE